MVSSSSGPLCRFKFCFSQEQEQQQQQQQEQEIICGLTSPFSASLIRMQIQNSQWTRSTASSAFADNLLDSSRQKSSDLDLRRPVWTNRKPRIRSRAGQELLTVLDCSGLVANRIWSSRHHPHSSGSPIKGSSSNLLLLQVLASWLLTS